MYGRRKAELVRARMLSKSVRELGWRMIDASPVGQVAGQFVDLFVPTAGGLLFRRSYSIASPPDASHPDFFELAVTLVEGGPTSAALHAMAPGGVVEVEGPSGHFVRPAEDRARPGLFVATGTGLAPIRAMLAGEVRSAEGPPLVVLFGCRTPGDVLWADELGRWQRACPRLQVHATLSRPPADWPGLSGYVQKHVVALARSLPGAHAYVCGVGAMVDDVVRLLARDAGIERSALHYEPYD